VLINKASGAVRCRHPPHARPGGGALPDAFGAARLLYEKTAGRSCRRRARTTLTARPAPPSAPSPPRTRGLRPTGRLPFSTDPRPRRARPRTGLRPGVARHDRRRSARQGPQAHRRAGLYENGLASHLDHPGRPRRSAADPAIDAGQPALGRAATARGLATPDATPLSGAASGRGPTLSRTGGILTRIRHHNNRPAAPGSQIPVHGFPNDAQFIGRLSTE